MSSHSSLPRAEDVVALFEQVVRSTPDRLAVSGPGGSLSFAELDARANRLAARLMAAGVTTESRVALSLGRGVGQIVAILAVWKANGAYVPFDPSHPEARLRTMLDDCRPDVVLTDSGEPRTPYRTLALDGDHDGARDTGTRTAADPAQLAYIIYTSGSTGAPKGVQIERGALAHLALANRMTLHPSLGDRPARIGLTAAFSFDASVNQMLWLLLGDSVWIVDDETRRDTRSLVAYLRENRIDAIEATPTQLSVMVELGLFTGDNPRPSLVIVGGEPTRPSLWQTLRAIPGTRFFNLYGPTETTVWVTAEPLRDAGDLPSIGRPVIDTRAYVVDGDGHRVANGTEGELWIGGPGVARGYWERAELTAERFLDDPFDPGGRVYRTGDRVLQRPDGRLDFLGRVDDQVQIRGFRVEPGEVADVLARHPQVSGAAVVARADASGVTRLVAYVVPSGHEERRSPEAVPPLADVLKTYVSEQLPDHMRPSLTVEVPSLPLTRNGKLDRDALPDPYRSTGQEEAAAGAPDPTLLSATEHAVAALWAKSLGLPSVDRHDNFFDLGGDSIAVTKVLAQISQQFGTELSLRDVLTTNLAEFCALIDTDLLSAVDDAELAQLLTEIEEDSK